MTGLLSAERRTRLKALASRSDVVALDLTAVPDLPPTRLTALAGAFTEDLDALAAAMSEAVATYRLETVRRMPVVQLDADWREAQTRFWPASSLGRRKVRKLLQTYVDDGEANPVVDLDALLAMRERDTALRESPLASIGGTGEPWDAKRTVETTRQAIVFRAATEPYRDLRRLDSLNQATLACS